MARMCFEETDIELAFQPYQTEAVTVIPVKGEEYDERFLVELYDLKGAVAGDYMSAVVTVPAGCVSKEQPERRVNDAYLDDFQSGSLMDKYPSQINLNHYGDVNIEYNDPSNPNIGTIMFEKSPIGKYIASKSGPMYSITKDGSGDQPSGREYQDRQCDQVREAYIFLLDRKGELASHRPDVEVGRRRDEGGRSDPYRLCRLLLI